MADLAYREVYHMNAQEVRFDSVPSYVGEIGEFVGEGGCAVEFVCHLGGAAD